MSRAPAPAEDASPWEARHPLCSVRSLSSLIGPSLIPSVLLPESMRSVHSAPFPWSFPCLCLSLSPVWAIQ